MSSGVAVAARGRVGRPGARHVLRSQHVGPLVATGERSVDAVRRRTDQDDEGEERQRPSGFGAGR